MDRDGGLLRPSEVLVVVEIVAPGSRRLDHVTKRHEYADPGIPHYWIVNLDPPASLLAHHLAEDFSYADSGLFTATVPFPPSPSDDEAHRAGDSLPGAEHLWLSAARALTTLGIDRAALSAAADEELPTGR